MVAVLGQSFLRFQISNRAWNTTLKYHGPRKNDYWDFLESFSLRSVLPPGCNDSGGFLSRSNALGHGWLVVYEAESFTLAIFFCLRKRPETPEKILQLEVSLDKAHLGNIRETFERMAELQDPPNPNKTFVSRTEFSSNSKVSVRLLAGPCKVSANVCCKSIPELKVLLEKRVALGTTPVGVGSTGNDPCGVF